MKTNEIREKYLEFFEAQGHARKPSDVLVPRDDPSVLFTPAGMNQFKDHFLGKVRLDFTRATTCQKCLRTGDIENVGRTPRHHTFFEMLGNFSFGDYFKREAIHWAWEFLTEKRWLGIDPARLNVTVYLDDDQAASIWHEEIGLSNDRIERCGEDDNFWPASAPSQGPDGVCGPCSEIFYINEDGSSLEIWNLVFTQFNRLGDPPNNLHPLPSQNIDTGMGLERTAAVLQGVDTNYHIDILLPIVKAAAEICGLAYEPGSDNGRRLRRITDHVRACTFAIHENVEPGKHKQNYVVRRLLRRAVLDGHQMSVDEPFLHQLVPAVVEQMGPTYPELRDTVSHVVGEIQREEASFFQTIDEAVDRIQHTFKELEGSGQKSVPGDRASELYTTYGVPPELFEQLADEQGLEFDWEGFRAAMEQHGLKSGGGKHTLFQTGAIEELKETQKQTEFIGYDRVTDEAVIKGIVAQEEIRERFDQLDSKDPVILILDRTPFYAESGGQVGDSGIISNESFRFEVHDTQKDSDLILHIGSLASGEIKNGDVVTCQVDQARRDGLQRAHSATHILHSALQHQIGSHAQQKGSKVEEDWLRFDFKNESQIAMEKLERIESEVADRIRESAEIRFDVIPLEEARDRGAMMLFGEKYPDLVRMVSIGEFSKELCGGTHLSNTREIERFEIVTEESVSAGTRRIVALTGRRAHDHELKTREAVQLIAQRLGVSPLNVSEEVSRVVQAVRRLKKQLASGKKEAAETCSSTIVRHDPVSIDYARIRTELKEAARLLNTTAFDAPERVDALVDELQDLTRQIEAMGQGESISADSLIANASQVAGTSIVAAVIDGGNPNRLRQLIDQVRKQVNPSAIMLGAKQSDDKLVLVAGLTRDLVDQGFSAGNWIKEVAPVVDGGGGGKPDMAQAGGKSPAKLPAAMEKAVDQMSEWLTKN